MGSSGRGLAFGGGGAILGESMQASGAGRQSGRIHPRGPEKNGIRTVSNSTLESALQLLEASLGQLEAAASRKLDLERRRGDLETELGIMQDDRARLATDLDGALSRLGQIELAAGDAVQRMDRAMGAIRDALGDGADERASH
jgi:hypothetical protein